MKIIAVIALALATIASEAAPKFVTAKMLRRNGLTDEQYEMVWNMGLRPRIEVAAARDWVFRASRYENVRDWLDEIGRTNDFARLAARVPHLTETNAMLVATNKVLKFEVKDWRDKADYYWDGWTNSYVTATNYLSKYSVATNNLRVAWQNYISASNRAEVAEAVAAAKANLIQGEIDRLKKEKAELEEKIASAAYIALRPWLRLKLAAVEAAIAKLEEKAAD